MATTRYLAMTASEFAVSGTLPPKPAWMACHFSPYGSGISDFPSALPADSILILNDRIPIRSHDPERISRELRQLAQTLNVHGILLDFQNYDERLAALAAQLVDSLPCPVAVSERYAKDLPCPVFLAPCPHHVHLETHISPWQGRELWLDLARDAQLVTVTPEGSRFAPLWQFHLPEDGYGDNLLHCHYRVRCSDSCAQFTLWRTNKDLEDLAREAEELGIRTLVGLYQEFH